MCAPTTSSVKRWIPNEPAMEEGRRSLPLACQVRLLAELRIVQRLSSAVQHPEIGRNLGGCYVTNYLQQPLVSSR
jgi:hypothetical protein